MPSGADLEYARMLAQAGVSPSASQGYDGARLEQLGDAAGYVPSQDVGIRTTLASTRPGDNGRKAVTIGNTHTSFTFTPGHGQGIYGPFVLYERFGLEAPGQQVRGTTQAGYVAANYYGPTPDDVMEAYSVWVSAADGGVPYTQSQPITAFEAQSGIAGNNVADINGHLRASAARINVRDTSTAARASAFYAGQVTVDPGATLAQFVAFEQSMSPTVSGLKYGVKVIDPVHTETEFRLTKTGVTAGVQFKVGAGSGGSASSLALLSMPNVTDGETDLSGLRIQQGAGGLKNLQEWWLSGGTAPVMRVSRLGGLVVAGGAGGIKYTNVDETTTYVALDSNGLNIGTTALQQTTVGVAGAASALPAAPNKYIKIKDAAGTTLVIPAYNA